jgi:hypothetical protein
LLQLLYLGLLWLLLHALRHMSVAIKDSDLQFIIIII